MDNIVDNKVYYVERKEIRPDNKLLEHAMNNSKIVQLIENLDNHITLTKLKKKHTCNNTTFRKINDTFILMNEDAESYMHECCGWRSSYSYITNQNLIPKEYLQYYMINYAYHTAPDITHIYFIIVLRIDTNGVSPEFIELFNKNEDSKLKNEDCSFMRYLRSQQKYHFDEMNNINNEEVDENMEISTRISKCNANYMTQKMIELPKFLKYKLYYYQRADINFMLQRESESSTKKFILDDEKIVNWGTKMQCILKKSADGDATSYFIPRRTIHNYKGKLNSFRGGCLCNSPGLGKTLEILTLCAINPSSNLIMVPEHLFDHWIHEYKKHIKKEHMVFICYSGEDIESTPLTKSVIYLITYKKLFDYKKLFKTEFTRFIIDEFHELFDKKEKYPEIEKIQAKYKWAITATPFVNSSMIYNIMNFIAEIPITNMEVTKYLHFINVFCEMFRKNTKESIEGELSLPKINEITYILSLSEMESTMLNSICNSSVDKETSITRQMAFCINPNLYFQDGSGISEKFIHVNICEAKVINMHKDDFEKLFHKVIEEKINYLGITKKFHLINMDIVVIYDFVVNKKDNLEHRILIMDKHYNKNEKTKLKKAIDFTSIDKSEFESFWLRCLCELSEKKTSIFGANTYNPRGTIEKINTIKKLEEDLEKIKSTMTYFEQQIKLINRKTKVHKRKIEDNDDIDYVEIKEDEEDITCSICLGEIDDDFTLLQCGHAYCTLCLKVMLTQTADKCPQCQFSLRNTTFYTPKIKQIVNKDFVELVKKYGTKIAHLINICKNKLTDDKTIVYCDSPSLIDNLVMILNDNGIQSITPDPKISIIKTVKEFQLSKQVLVLSSEFNASGLNIQFAKNIILLQPIRGDYARIRQIENQIIGRVHRIGQTKEVNIIRLIIKNSIESEILRQNKIIDTDYSSIGKKTDFPMTCHQTKELEDE